MINAAKLNSISDDLFKYKSANTQDKVIKVCSADGKNVLNLDRDDIIVNGRYATLEHFGKIANMDKDAPIKFNSTLKHYGNYQKKVMQNTVLYCAALANKAVGLEPYTNINDVANDVNLYRNPIFWHALAYISQEVITPLFPAVIPAATERLVNWNRARLGETKLVSIKSNDFFLFDDDSWGSVSSKPYQYLYKDMIALTPKPYTAKTKIKWYQDIIDGEAGEYYAAFMRGAYNKMYAIMLARFNKAMANEKYIPAENKWDSFTPQNWTDAIMAAEALNGVPRNQLAAMGSLSALSKILPTVGTPAVAAGIQGQIGVEWVRNGFLANVFGVDLIETGLAVVPGTQNYKPKYIGLSDNGQDKIFIFAKNGYSLMEGAIAEGSPITITFTPEETADMTIDISETIIFDIQPAFSQKVMEILVD